MRLSPLCCRTYRPGRLEKPSCTEWSRSVKVLPVQPLVRMSCPGSPDPHGSVVNRWVGALCDACACVGAVTLVVIDVVAALWSRHLLHAVQPANLAGLFD